MPARWLTNGVTTPGRHDSGPRAILTGISRVWAEKLDVPVADDCSSGKFALALSRVTEIDEQVVAAMAASLARGGPAVRGQLIASRFYEASDRLPHVFNGPGQIGILASIVMVRPRPARTDSETNALLCRPPAEQTATAIEKACLFQRQMGPKSGNRRSTL